MNKRQRVLHACEACRKKKIKCDGEQPCQSCNRGSADCVYADPSGNALLYNPKYIISLQDRISSMEARLWSGSERIESHRSSLRDQEVSQPAESQRRLTGDEEYPAISMHPSAGLASSPSVTEPRSSREEQVRATEPEQHPEPLNRSLSNQDTRPVSIGPQSIQKPFQPDLDLYNFGNFIFESDTQVNDGNESVQSLSDAKSFPDELRALLIDHFFHTIYPIFPIIEEKDFRTQLNGAYSLHEESNHELAFVLYAILAAAASDLKSNDPIWEDPRMRPYASTNLSQLFYSYVSTKFSLALPNTKCVSNSVIGHGLLGLCLSESGKIYEAWVTTGHAIRLYQGLDNSSDCKKSTVATNASGERGNLWWCLYILDRSLSTVLLKPLAIDDEECDVEDEAKPSTPHTHPHMDFWFSVIVDCHIFIGRIYKLGRAIRRSTRSSKPNTEEKLRTYVRRLDKDLEDYFTQEVFPRIQESPSSAKAAPLQLVAISSYYAGVILLHRAFLETYSSAEPEMLLRCAEAASACIRFTPRLLDAVPASHFLIQQLRAHFAGSKVLLHCVRLASNQTFTAKALSDVETGMAILGDAKVVWPEAKDYERLIREELLSTTAEVERQKMINNIFEKFGHGLSSNAPLVARRTDVADHGEKGLDTCNFQQHSDELPNSVRSLAERTSFLAGTGSTDIEGTGTKRRHATMENETTSNDVTRHPDPSLASIFNLSSSSTFPMIIGDEEFGLLNDSLQ